MSQRRDLEIDGRHGTQREKVLLLVLASEHSGRYQSTHLDLPTVDLGPPVKQWTRKGGQKVVKGWSCRQN
jgi:hypothetical protein